MERNGITFEILVHANPIREYPYDDGYDDGLVFVEGRAGSEYTLLIRNNTRQRVLAVPTVDGLSVMDGRIGSFNSSGYVLEPHGSANIPGWRLDNKRVAHFFFAKKGEAYAALVDKATNIGVIGCAIFREKIVIPSFAFRSTLSGDLDALRSGGNTKGSFGTIGTGFGRETEHRVTEVDFKRETTPFSVFEIHYDDRAGLLARGVNLEVRPQVATANPFPGEPANGCPPPPGWKGYK